MRYILVPVVLLLLVLSATPPKNRPIAEIKFERAFGSIVFFDTTVNGVGPLQFLLDTGGAGSSIDRATAQRLGMQMERAQASVSGNAALEVGVIPSARVRLGRVQFEGQLIGAPLAPLEPIFGRRLEGILGGNFMRQYVVELDYEKHFMRLYEPSTYRHDGRSTVLPFTLVNGIPFVEMQVALPNGKSTRGSFLVDSGGNMVVHIHKQVAEREGLLDGLTTLKETGYGIGGGATQRVAARGSLLVLGEHRFTRPIVVFTEDTAGLRANPQSIGLVGMEVLRRFKVVFDYSRSRMYLDPTRSLGQPFVYDVSGLKLRANGPSFSPPYVSSVREWSPASEAGIITGDVISEIDGRTTLGLSLEKVREILGRPGETHTLTLSRKEKTMKTVLRTRELLN